MKKNIRNKCPKTNMYKMFNANTIQFQYNFKSNQSITKRKCKVEKNI